MAFNTPHRPRKGRKIKVSIMMTSYHEKELGKAVNAILDQWKESYELLIVSPDKEGKNIAEKETKKNRQVRWIKDKGLGKSAAVNHALPQAQGKILVLTDGDVMLFPQAIHEIIKTFDDKKIGCVSGRVISANPRTTMLGYWSHLLADAGAHQIRMELSQQEKFLECTGYLFAFRKGIISKIPLDVAEDTIIPYVCYQKGYKIRYAPKAKVLVKNPTTFKDWLKQRKRTAKAHETLNKYVNTKDIPRVKTFTNELKKGWLLALAYPRTLREIWWTLLLFGARLLMWILVCYETRIIKQSYKDKWERVESAR